MLVQIIEKTLETLRKANDEPHVETGNQPASPNDSDAFPAPKRLAWKINDELRRAIETAAVDVDRWALAGSRQIE